MADYNCIDVSEWNGDIDWETARDAGVEYAMIRCGFGQDIESQDDKYFHINMENALAAGVKIGVYFYSYASDGDMAAGEAEHCLRLVEPYKDKLSLPVFYDLEEEKCIPNVYDIYTTFEKILNDHGYNVGGYASQYWFDTCLKPVGMTYTWDAKWGGRKPDWEISIWQYSDNGSVPGVGDGVDLDIVYDTDMKPLIDGGSSDDDDDDDDEPKTVNIEMNIIKLGDTGNQVETLQILLNAFGFRDSDGNLLAVDSIFGPKTDQAVKSYQAARGIEADGIVGYQTWSRILK